MKTYTMVSRKSLEEDRIAICPKFGCESLTRVKPLKFGFLGFGKYPKCKKHKMPLIYIDERIGDFVDAALSCLFDISSLPPKNLLSMISEKIPNELDTFVKIWISCITIGRGAPIISRYMDSISNSYLKHLTKKQIKSINNCDKTKKNNYQTIKNGLQEVTNQYTRLLKHLRTHHEVFNYPKQLKPFSNSLRTILTIWLENCKKVEKEIISNEQKSDKSLTEVKNMYDSLLNIGILMCLLGYSTKKREKLTNKITAFDRFNAYHEFYTNGITRKFTKNDILALYQNIFQNSEENLCTFASFGRKLSVNNPGLKIITPKRDIINQYTHSNEKNMIYNSFLKKLKSPSDNSNTNANNWFTQILLETMKHYSFLKEYASLRKMSIPFGLSDSYLYDKRYKKSVISHEYLDEMRKNISEFIKKKIRSDTNLTKKALKARNQIVTIIEKYRNENNPKLTANTQISKKLKKSYFHDISSPQQAYYLGLLFADGWITIARSKGGSRSFRISLSLKVEDKPIIKRFAQEIGLNESRVLERDSKDPKTGNVYRMAYLQFGVGSTSIKNSMARDLIKLGMTYKKDTMGKRSKVPILPVFCNIKGEVDQDLMLAFLLGYFDGDGTLKGSNGGEIYSSNYNFISAIKIVYNLGKICKIERVKFDPLKKFHTKRSLYSLYINKEMFKDIMSLNLNSMERKRVDPKSIVLNAPLMTKQRLWIKKELPKEYLKTILKTHSPSKIAKLIGIDHNTFLKFLRVVYNIKPKEKGYYIALSYDRKQQSDNSELNRIYVETTRHLIDIGKRNPFIQ